MSRDAALATRAGGGRGGVRRVQVTLCDQEQRVGRIWVDADADYSRVAAHIERDADVDRRGRDRAFWSALQPGALVGDGRTALAARMRLVSAGPRYVVWNSCPFATVDEIAAVVAAPNADTAGRHPARNYASGGGDDEFFENGGATAGASGDEAVASDALASDAAYATHILLLLDPGAVVLLVECRLPSLGVDACDYDDHGSETATRAVASTPSRRTRPQTHTFVASRRTLLKHAATLDRLFAYVARKSGCCGVASRGGDGSDADRDLTPGGGGGGGGGGAADVDSGEAHRDAAFHSLSTDTATRSYSSPSGAVLPSMSPTRAKLPIGATTRANLPAAAAAAVPISHTVMTDQHTLDYFRHLEHPTAHLGDTHLPVFVVHHLPTASFALDSRRVAIVLFLVLVALALRWVFGEMRPTEFVRWSERAVAVWWQTLT